MTWARSPRTDPGGGHTGRALPPEWIASIDNSWLLSTFWSRVVRQGWRLQFLWSLANVSDRIFQGRTAPRHTTMAIRQGWLQVGTDSDRILESSKDSNSVNTLRPVPA